MRLVSSSSLVVSSFAVSGSSVGLVASFLFVSFFGQVVFCVDFCYGRFF